MAFGAMDAVRSRSIRIPEQIQVVGFDDIRTASWPAFNLTTIAQPMDALLERAVEMILDRWPAPNRKSETVYVNGELRERGSTLPRRPGRLGSASGAPAHFPQPVAKIS
jgi:DNA-binding LacI/PurR family transcriptional regulator